MKSQAFTSEQLRALATTAQPICLIGGSRASRWEVIGAVHREWMGKVPDPTSPHPDLSLLAPSSGESRPDPAPGGAAAMPGSVGSIGIDSVRSFVDRLSLTPYAASLRVGIVEPASALTIESQNALLRYIEEPTRSSRIILSTRRSEELLPTLLSRCRLVRIPGGALGSGPTPELIEACGSEEAAGRLVDLMDNPDAAERLAELGLAKPALSLYESVVSRRRPAPEIVGAFMDKHLPVGESTLLFSEIVFAAACARLAAGPGDLPLARSLLALQGELRYHPPRAVVVASILERIESGGPT